jgi:hypothetical protein
VHPTKPKKVHNNLIVKIESLIESTGSRFSRLLCYLLTLVLQILFVAVLPNFPARSQFNIAVNFTVYIAHSKFPGDLPPPPKKIRLSRLSRNFFPAAAAEKNTASH